MGVYFPEEIFDPLDPFLKLAIGLYDLRNVQLSAGKLASKFMKCASGLCDFFCELLKLKKIGHIIMWIQNFEGNLLFHMRVDLR